MLHTESTYSIRLVDFILLGNSKAVVLIQDNRSDIYFSVTFDKGIIERNRQMVESWHRMVRQA